MALGPLTLESAPTLRARSYDFPGYLQNTHQLRQRVETFLRRMHEETPEMLKLVGLYEGTAQERETAEPLLQRLMEVSALARKILLRPALEFSQSYAQKGEKIDDALLQQWETAVFHLYALCMPHPDPDKSEYILNAEKATGEKSLSRKSTLWTSQPGDTQPIPKEHFSLGYLNSLSDPAQKKKLESRRIDILKWDGAAGLPLHTTVASVGIQRLIEAMQQYLLEEEAKTGKKGELDVWKQYILSMEPKLARIWLNMHDIGRLIHHHPHYHAVFTQLISQLATLPDEFSRDYDLPTLLDFSKETPQPSVDHSQYLQRESDEDEAEFLQRKQVAYIEEVLQYLEATANARHDNDSPIAILLFWLVDAYTKLYDVAGKQPLASQTSELSNRKVMAHNFGHFSNIQPSDSDHFLGRVRYRLAQNNGNDLTPEDEAMIRYYTRQYDLADSIFTFLTKRIGIPRELIEKVFMEYTLFTQELLDPATGEYQYQYLDTKRYAHWTQNFHERKITVQKNTQAGFEEREQKHSDVHERMAAFLERHKALAFRSARKAKERESNSLEAPTDS